MLEKTGSKKKENFRRRFRMGVGVFLTADRRCDGGRKLMVCADVD